MPAFDRFNLCDLGLEDVSEMYLRPVCEHLRPTAESVVFPAWNRDRAIVAWEFQGELIEESFERRTITDLLPRELVKRW
jgi:hypothetical protein